MLKGLLIGNIGGDPNLSYSANGNALLRFNVASNDRRKNSDGSYTDQTTWVRVTLTGKRAETLSQYLKRGSKVYVDGKLEARPWTDQQGNIRAGLEMLAGDIEFMSSRNGASDGDEPF